jgi:hypothetical protein
VTCALDPVCRGLNAVEGGLRWIWLVMVRTGEIPCLTVTFRVVAEIVLKRDPSRSEIVLHSIAVRWSGVRLFVWSFVCWLVSSGAGVRLVRVPVVINSCNRASVQAPSCNSSATIGSCYRLEKRSLRVACNSDQDPTSSIARDFLRPTICSRMSDPVRPHCAPMVGFSGLTL